MIYKDTLTKLTSGEQSLVKFIGVDSAKNFWKLLSDIFYHVYMPMLTEQRIGYSPVAETNTPLPYKFAHSDMVAVTEPSTSNIGQCMMPIRSSGDFPSFMLFLDLLSYSMGEEPFFYQLIKGDTAIGNIYHWNSTINNIFKSNKGLKYDFPYMNWSDFLYNPTFKIKDWNGHDVEPKNYQSSYWFNFVPSAYAHKWFRFAFNVLPIYQTTPYASIGCGVTWLSPLNRTVTDATLDFSVFDNGMQLFETSFTDAKETLLELFPRGIPSITSSNLGNLLCCDDAKSYFDFTESFPIYKLFFDEVLNWIKFSDLGHQRYSADDYISDIGWTHEAMSKGLTSELREATENANIIKIGNGGIIDGSEDLHELPVYTFPSKIKRLDRGCIEKCSLEDFPEFADDYIITPQRLIAENLVGLAYDWDAVLNGYDTIVGCNFSYDNYVVMTGFGALYGHIQKVYTAKQFTECTLDYDEESSTPSHKMYKLVAKRTTGIEINSEWEKLSEVQIGNTLGMQRRTIHDYNTLDNPYIESTVDYSFGIYCHNVGIQAQVGDKPYFDIFDDDEFFRNIPKQYQPFNLDVYMNAIRALFPNTPNQNKLDAIDAENKRHDNEIEILNRRKETVQERLDNLPDEKIPLEENIGVDIFKVCLTDWLYRDTSEYSAPIVDAINLDLQNYLNHGASSPFTQAVRFMEAPPYCKGFYIDDTQWFWDLDSYFTNPYGGPNSLVGDVRDYFFFAMSALNARGWYDDKPLSYAQAVRILNDYCNGKDGITFLKNFATLDNEDIFQGATFEWKTTIMDVTTFIMDVCSNYISDLLNTLGESYLKRRMDVDNLAIFNRLKQECEQGDMTAFEAYWLDRVRLSVDDSRENPKYQEYWMYVDEIELVETLIQDENELHIQNLDEIDLREFPLILPSPDELMPLLALVSDSAGTIKPFEQAKTSLFSIRGYIPYTPTCGKTYWELYGKSKSAYPDYNPATQSSTMWEYDNTQSDYYYELEKDYFTTCDRYPVRDDVHIEYLGAIRTTISMTEGQGCENYSRLFNVGYDNSNAFDNFRKDISDACYDLLKVYEPNFDNADKFIGGDNGLPSEQTLKSADYNITKLYTEEEVFGGASHEEITITGISLCTSYPEKLLFVKDNSTATSPYDYKEKVFISITFSNGVVIDTHQLLFSNPFIVGFPLQSKQTATIEIPSTMKLEAEFIGVPELDDCVFTVQYHHTVLCKTSENNNIEI